MPLQKSTLMQTLPSPWPEDVFPSIVEQVHQAGVKVVVLDDDPTGCQTVHDVVVLTGWSVQTLTDALRDPTPVVYVLTNTRSMSLAQAQSLNREIACNLQQARATTGRDFVIISRSDSTLRGHYPGEVDALREALDASFDGTLIIPFFVEGGRITAGDVHYVTEGDTLVPAAETEYARDAVFGYQHSDLRAWVCEKHSGDMTPEDVAHVTLADIRQGGPDVVARKLMTVSGGQVCVVNAVCYRDLEVFTAGLLRAEAQGKRYLYRTAASFVRVRGGILLQPRLSAAELDHPPGGGLVIVGSHVQKSTAQMRAARELPGMETQEITVPPLLDPVQREAHVQNAIATLNQHLAAGRDVMVYTSRDVITQHTEYSALQIAQQVSAALVALVAHLPTRPAWMIAKGGITSSDLATGGLEIQRAYVLGQAIPGVPIWRAGEESRWPGLIYVVFPGNVGRPGALADMVRVLRGTN